MIIALILDVVIDEYEKSKGGMEEMTLEETLTFLRINLASLIFTFIQYVFSQYMNTFLLYLIHTFTKDNSSHDTSVAFLQTEG